MSSGVFILFQILLLLHYKRRLRLQLFFSDSCFLNILLYLIPFDVIESEQFMLFLEKHSPKGQTGVSSVS